MRIPVLTSDLHFPEPLRGMDGLVAIGGDLSTKRLLAAYEQGVFPWFNPEDPICWWSPDPRCVFIPGEVKVSKSLRQRLRKTDYHVTTDRDFEAVIHHCANAKDRQNATWISSRMKKAYLLLFQSGYAHSFEVRNAEGQLVGGLYGVSIGAAFFGESMFSLQPDASKLALLAVDAFARQNDFLLIDGQLENDYLIQMGARMMPRPTFLEKLGLSKEKPTIGGHWDFTYRHAV